MRGFATTVVFLTFLNLVSAHVALWDKGMFGLNYPYQADDPQNNNYNNDAPVKPLRELDGLTTDQWFAHGHKGYPPKAGNFMVLPAGGSYNGKSCFFIPSVLVILQFECQPLTTYWSHNRRSSLQPSSDDFA
ncbi:hypothetical protein I317_05021 [Kwoniella heveanensis CBS 569]|uniref:Uncharacterized protein n=1 Tax=Kwoniella heveanensis BCC8398 TaxID=1296120 RepID=A0A1B9H2R6_9TREE|nr:hypothetical protein I316_00688 [Kwoniella heveanensis BCC8398]OCF41191.1 hypothetical protein I317_05021 [Kwoniella heveanensis CBS 569]